MSISISLITMSLSTSSGADQKNTTCIDMNLLYNTDKNSYSVELFNDFVDNCSSETINGLETTTYPDNYGGAYIDSSNILHFKIVPKSDELSNEEIKYYISTLENDIIDKNRDIVMESANVTLNKLLEIQDSLDLVMTEYNISSTYTDEEANVLIISLIEYSNKEGILKYLEKNIDDFNQSYVSFEKGTETSFSFGNTSSNALSGSVTSSSNGSATLGFNAYRSATSSYGTVTAAHFATNNTTIFNASGSSIGSAQVRQLSGTLDAAYVPFGNNISPSDRINQISYPDDKLTGFYSNASIVQGMSTTKVGAVAGVNYGSVLSANSSVTVDNINFSEQVRVSNTQNAGDSGGPVFHSFIGPIQPGVFRPNTLIGIVTIRETSTGYGYASKAGNIMNTFGLTLY